MKTEDRVTQADPEQYKSFLLAAPTVSAPVLKAAKSAKLQHQELGRRDAQWCLRIS